MLIRPLIYTSLCLSLVACANISKTPNNTPYNQVVAEFGQPSIECINKDGQTRAIWSTQPMGQYAWGGNIDASGNLEQMQPILTDEHFQILNKGKWTYDEVMCEFGPPAFKDSVGLPNVRQNVWNYRYRENHVWNSLMFVFFDPSTGQVTKFHPGPDPRYDPDYYFPY